MTESGEGGGIGKRRTVTVVPPTTVVSVLVTPKIVVNTVLVVPPTTLVTVTGCPVRVRVTVWITFVDRG